MKPFGSEPVPYAADGVDIARRVRVGLDLLAEVLHVRINRPVVTCEMVSEGAGNEFLAGEYVPGISREKTEEPELPRGHAHGRPGLPHGHGGIVNGQVIAIEAHHAIRGGAGVRGTAQDGIHAGHKLPWAEWLGDIVVGSDLESPHCMLFLDLCREHDDGHA
jgi:hypothetical protein